MPLAVDNLTASLGDSSRNLVVDDTEGMVGLDGSQLHVSDSDDEIRIVNHRLA